MIYVKRIEMKIIRLRYIGTPIQIIIIIIIIRCYYQMSRSTLGSNLTTNMHYFLLSRVKKNIMLWKYIIFPCLGTGETT